MNSEYRAFPRPKTGFNSLIDSVVRYFPARRMTTQDIERWQSSSLTLFGEMNGDAGVLQRIIANTSWEISDADLPDNVWALEVVFNGRENPRVVIYQRTLLSRLPLGKRWFELLGQSATDHAFGHLYPFYAHASDYGEEAACRHQHRAAGKRGGKYRVVRWLLPIVYVLHKRIPLATYRDENPP